MCMPQICLLEMVTYDPRMHACMYVCVYVCMYGCMYVVCMYVYMYVCMFVCMYVCTIFIRIKAGLKYVQGLKYMPGSTAE